MKLLPKTSLIISMTLFVMLTFFYLFFSQTLLKTYAELEAKEVQRDLERVRDGIQYEIKSVNELVTDWAEWDDTYQFVDDHNEEYIDSNLLIETLAGIRINAAIFFNQHKQVIEKIGQKMSEEEAVPWEVDELYQHILASPSLVEQISTSKENYGLVTLSDEVLILAMHSIIRSDGSGPIQGSLLFGRFFDDTLAEGLAQRLKLNVNYYRAKEALGTKHFQPVLAALEAGKSVVVVPQNDQVVYGFTLFRDIHNAPGLLIQLQSDRTIYQQGQQLINSFLITLTFFGLFFMGISLILLQKTVLSRLFRLVEDVQDITHRGDITNAQVHVIGHDEIAILSKEVNTMLDSLAEHRQALSIEKEKSEALLHNILPTSIAKRMKQGETMIVDHFDAVTVLFCDIVGFTQLAAGISPDELVDKLNKIFSEFDHIAEKYHLEKIKMIGDAYMVVGGLPEQRSDHAEAIAQLAIEMLSALSKLDHYFNEAINVRIGIHSGEAVAGIIGTRKFAYDLWGDTVNTAARMESHGETGKIHCTETVYQLLKNQFIFKKRSPLIIKGKGLMQTYFLVGTHE
jgi:sensor domain CHASE-containing protein/class 3 adenylate cyclase